jgi:hypothetical protein
MKPLIVLVGLFAAVAAGAVGGFLAAPAAAQKEHASARSDAAPSAPTAAVNAAAPAVALDAHAYGEQIDALTSEVARLRADLLAIKEGRVRESAIPEDARQSAELAASDEAFLANHRGAILRVLADERAAAAKQAEDERRQRDLDAAAQRAERMAKELGMTTAQRDSLADIYFTEREKREEFMKGLREGTVPEDREQMRQTFQQYRDWRTNEMNTRLGAELATRVTELEGERGMGGFGMRGEFGGGGGGGRNNGNNADGRTRRNRTDNDAPPTGGG